MLNFASIKAMPNDERMISVRDGFYKAIGCQPDDLEDLIDFSNADVSEIDKFTERNRQWCSLRIWIGSAKIDYSPFGDEETIVIHNHKDDVRAIKQVIDKHKECKRQVAEIAMLKAEIAMLRAEIAELRMSPDPGPDYLAAKARFDEAKDKKN